MLYVSNVGEKWNKLHFSSIYFCPFVSEKGIYLDEPSNAKEQEVKVCAVRELNLRTCETVPFQVLKSILISFIGQLLCTDNCQKL